MRKIPSEDLIIEILKKILKERGEVETLIELRKLVLDKLKQLDQSYTLSLERLRKVAAKQGLISKIVYREMNSQCTDLKKCPVCLSDLSFIVNKKIDGGTVIIGVKCETCGYTSSSRKRIPTKYYFAIR